MVERRADLSVQYVDRILDVLETLAESPTPVGLNELSAMSGINKTTVYRILSALQRRHYVQQTPQQQYTPGPNWHRHSRSPAVSGSAIARVRALLPELRDAQGETVHLAVYQPTGYAVYIDVLESPKPLRTSSHIGAVSPAFCVSTGKALLAQQGEVEISTVCQTLQAHTPYSLTDPDNLRHELRETRRRGYSVNRQEYQLDVCGVAVPLFTHYGEVFAAVGYCVPASRFTDDRISQFVESLCEVLADFVPKPQASLPSRMSSIADDLGG